MKKQSIKINYIFNTLYQILSLIAPLITAPYVSRVLGANGVGIYSYTSSVVAFFTMFAVLGTATYGQRAIAQCRDNQERLGKCFWEIECLSIITTTICIIVWLVYALTNTQYRLYFLILTIDLLAAAFDIVWFYNGLEQFKLIVLRNAAVKLFNIILLFVLVKARDDVWIYIAIMATGKLLGNLSMWFSLGKIVKRVPFKELNIFSHFKETLAYFIPTAAASVYTYLDKVMIGAFTETTVENGYYEQAQKIIKMGYAFLISINIVMSSRMSYLFAKENTDEIKAKLDKVLRFILTFGLALVFGVASVASNLVPWFLGDGFEKVPTLLIIGSVLILIMALHNFLSSQYLIPSGQRVRSTKGVIVGSITNFCFNMLLIPRFQSIGAMIATIVGETSICVVYLIMSKEYVPVQNFLKYLPKPLASGVLMSICLWFIGRGHSGSIRITLIQIIGGAVVYIAALILLKDEFSTNMICLAVSFLRRKLSRENQ